MGTVIEPVTASSGAHPATLFEFPHPVNDNAARVVAAGVAILALTAWSPAGCG